MHRLELLLLENGIVKNILSVSDEVLIYSKAFLKNGFKIPAFKNIYKLLG
jgi:hypothetical protein